MKDFIDSCPPPFIGVDEAGRGCLAGPVCAAAVVLKRTDCHYSDSKTLTPQQRSVLALQISKHHQTGIGWADSTEIDQINILQASLLACKRAVLNLKLKTGTVLIDGPFPIPCLPQFLQHPIIKGDSKVNVISAASILAKHSRDQKMQEFSKKYPGYSFERHKGYPTPSHKKVLTNLGPCPIHRKSFSGVKSEKSSKRNFK